nr:hypothetical protein [uncultured Lamprocystis sp.]
MGGGEFRQLNRRPGRPRYFPPGLATRAESTGLDSLKWPKSRYIDLALEGPQLDDAQLLALENQLDDLLLPYQIDVSRLAGIRNEALLEHIGRVGQVFYER